MNKNFHSWVTKERSQEFVLKCLCWAKLSVMPLICVRTKPWTWLRTIFQLNPPDIVLAFIVKSFFFFSKLCKEKLLSLHTFYLVHSIFVPHKHSLTCLIICVMYFKVWLNSYTNFTQNVLKLAFLYVTCISEWTETDITTAELLAGSTVVARV